MRQHTVNDIKKCSMLEQNGLAEIRWHGRGGQGVVTAGEIMAETALDEGRYFQAFPEFGAERTGAPVRASNDRRKHGRWVQSLHLVIWKNCWLAT